VFLDQLKYHSTNLNVACYQKQLTAVLYLSSAPHMSSSDATAFVTDAYAPPGFITALPLAVTGDLHGSYKLSGTSGKFTLTWCILFVCAEKWNAK
jgi:hypothetical protein